MNMFTAQEHPSKLFRKSSVTRKTEKPPHKSGQFEVRPICFPSLMEVLSKYIITR
ncbi:hypothetical protein SAMN04488069_1432 [Hymenobacter psychrophilus]|uniref:Uncharacterized protein n=1 Tax=Hymenobacter psychrophilus TaxID=651662 RepID=A0A1H3PN40_9BACT|nr:hypothetical protein SAMN04488069_1432 [Hymenobacter psychrophilus]